METNTLSVPGPLVEVDWLARHIDHPDLVLLDAGVGAHRAAATGIPGARPFDLDDTLSDPSDPLPHTMPGAEQFQREVRALGVGERSTVVVYDGAGIYSSARAWWMFRAMGHDGVAVLDGGLPAWTAAGLPQAPFATAAPGDFTARPRPEYFVGNAEVRTALGDPAVAVLDARARERFTGAVAEPRPGLRAGHMPGSINLPFTELQSAGRMLPAAELRSVIVELTGPRERLILSCGSGVTACNLALAATLAGYRDLAVYDGSWSEWGRPSDLPVATG